MVIFLKHKNFKASRLFTRCRPIVDQEEWPCAKKWIFWFVWIHMPKKRQFWVFVFMSYLFPYFLPSFLLTTLTYGKPFINISNINTTFPCHGPLTFALRELLLLTGTPAGAIMWAMSGEGWKILELQPAYPIQSKPNQSYPIQSNQTCDGWDCQLSKCPHCPPMAINGTTSPHWDWTCETLGDISYRCWCGRSCKSNALRTYMKQQWPRRGWQLLHHLANTTFTYT